jgi:hypothetical protein
MDPIGFGIVAVVIILLIVWFARRSGGDQPGDRGPYSTAMEIRGDLAAFGATISEPPDADRRQSADSDED